ncbi:GGDEF domain-containing protein [Ciceribacter sp. L1K23]|uniref:GGDEF domain-containing protein n=1 Tax=Ciceribacter sp. L1K23 TaxID=2820276 RepID=UPI001B81F394|nr:GGDEF domain-containing protein [Ciceribacter sp. L1K23]MBR0555246.1 GGDEF domain-containing protein [Ciceribacter sp. L1K23]
MSMTTQQSPVWHQTMIFRIFVVSFVCIHLPLLALAALFFSRGLAEDLAAFWTVLGATLVGTVVCLGLMWKIVSPIRRLSKAISVYRATGHLSESRLDKRGNSEIGIVTRGVCGLVGEIAVLGEQVTERAMRDPLTGLANARGIYDMGDERLAEVVLGQGKLSVVVFDLDRYGDIRRRHGREAADRALVVVGDIVRGVLGPADLGGRLSEKTFALVLVGANQKDARERAEALRATLETASTNAVEQGSLISSFGVATRASKNPSIAELIHAADMAVYRAKETGRNRVEVSTV